ncbi:MAG: hypothetical protein ACLS43_03450 [Evtepia gabavorous]
MRASDLYHPGIQGRLPESPAHGQLRATRQLGGTIDHPERSVTPSPSAG